MTKAEVVLWKRLKELPWDFEAQKVVCGYIPDFVEESSYLIIEVDGEYHNTPYQKKKDARRTRHLNQEGYKVIRFMNEEVLTNLGLVVERILAQCHYEPELL